MATDGTQTSTATPPAPAAPTPPVTSTKALAAEYDLGDTGPGEVEYTTTATPAPATAKSDVSAPALPQQQHSKRLLRMATDLGVSKETIESTPSDQLDDMVYELNRQAMSLAREHSRGEVQTGDRPRNADGTFAPKPAAAPAAAEEIEIPGLKKEDFDEGFWGWLQSRERQFKQLETVVQTLSHREMGREQETNTQRIDGNFDKLPGFEAIFGKGRPEKGSAEHKARLAIVKLVASDNKDPRDFNALQEAAADFYGRFAGPASANAGRSAPSSPLSEQQRRWTEGATAKPTQRIGANEPKGTKRAEQAAAKFMRETGMLNDDEHEKNGFLPDE